MPPAPAPVPPDPRTGLILTGGGARAAYQVGVLRALSRIRRESGQSPGNPFPIIAGTSAGAINAAALACQADHWDSAVAELADTWSALTAEQVYRTDSIGVIRSGAGWLTMLSLGWMLARFKRLKPRSLLDNHPLAGLLHRLVRLERLPQVLVDGHLQALAITASSYSTGRHLTFYQSVNPLRPWTRSQRLAVPCQIRRRHLLASSAIPFVFPAVPLSVDGQREWCGDGSMRQAAPISPAVHLGADRVLVIGAGRLHEPSTPVVRHQGPPPLAQIGGQALSSIFLDALAVDIERLQRVNHTLSLLPPEARAQTPLKPIDVLVIAPSQRLDDIAERHLDALPAAVRGLLRAVGVSSAGRGAAAGAAFASYLLFEPPFTRALIALGEADTEARREEVVHFFGWRRDVVAEAPLMALTQPA
jgi:NTE family protein